MKSGFLAGYDCWNFLQAVATCKHVESYSSGGQKNMVFWKDCPFRLTSLDRVACLANDAERSKRSEVTTIGTA